MIRISRAAWSSACLLRMNRRGCQAVHEADIHHAKLRIDIRLVHDVTRWKDGRAKRRPNRHETREASAGRTRLMTMRRRRGHGGAAEPWGDRSAEPRPTCVRCAVAPRQVRALSRAHDNTQEVVMQTRIITSGFSLRHSWLVRAAGALLAIGAIA